jgi:type I restriction enzyme S subunit
MGGEWKEVAFADVVEIISGGTPKTNVPEYWDGPIPWLSVKDFNTGYRWVSTAEKTITERGLSESSTTILSKGDIIISARGTVGVVAQLDRPMAFNQSCYGIRGKQRTTETNFIYYALRYAVARMQQIAHGAVFNTITRDTFKIIKTNLPPLSEQQAIGCILGALDDKIELNRKMNRTLEEMAQAIFKSWFVDFDPVHAKAAVRREHPGWTNEQISRAACPNLKPEIAALFPDSFEDSELGEIPKGWKIQSFTDEVEVIGGGTPKTSVPEYWGGEIPWFSVVDTPAPGEVFVVSTQKTITTEGLNSSSARILSVGTTIISARGTVGNLALVGVPMAMNQSCYGLRPRHGRRGYYVYFATAALVEILRQRAHGSVFSTITRETLGGTQVVAPPSDLMQTFERVVDGLLKRVLANQHQSRTLAALRDVLLPKLISGELRVPDAERIVGRCV